MGPRKRAQPGPGGGSGYTSVRCSGQIRGRGTLREEQSLASVLLLSLGCSVRQLD